MKEILSFLILAVFLSSLSGCTGESSAQSSLRESRFVELNKGISPKTAYRRKAGKGNFFSGRLRGRVE